MSFRVALVKFHWFGINWHVFYQSECRNCSLYISIQKIASQAESGKYIYVIGRLEGPYREKLWLRSWKCCPGRGQHFQARGHSFSLYGPTLRRPITFLSFSSCRKLAYKFFASGFVYTTLPLNRLTRRLQYKPFAKNLTSKRANKSNTIPRKMYWRTDLFRTTLC